MEYKKFDEEREIKETECGVIVLRAIERQETVPLFCPCCEYPMKSQDDFLSFRKTGCCDMCSIHFANTNIENWNKGWRPNKESESWKDFLLKKDLSSRKKVSFK